MKIKFGSCIIHVFALLEKILEQYDDSPASAGKVGASWSPYRRIGNAAPTSRWGSRRGWPPYRRREARSF
ncbi:protein of unknown function [Thiomonas sp. CB2]|nr:protein of unknown function [Thiomonas sp. CB2]